MQPAVTHICVCDPWVTSIVCCLPLRLFLCFVANYCRSLAVVWQESANSCRLLILASWILAMHQTWNSWDTAQFRANDTTVSPHVSVPSSPPAVSKTPAIARVASALYPTQLSPEWWASILLVVSTFITAEPTSFCPRGESLHHS